MSPLFGEAAPTATPLRPAAAQLELMDWSPPSGFGDALDRFVSGLMPDTLIATIRDEHHRRGLTQEQFAVEVGLSRPQVANIFARRFGASPGAVDRIKSWWMGGRA